MKSNFKCTFFFFFFSFCVYVCVEYSSC